MISLVYAFWVSYLKSVLLSYYNIVAFNAKDIAVKKRRLESGHCVL